jgi:hypothetical protein
MRYRLCGSSACGPVVSSAGGADLGVGDLVGEQLWRRRMETPLLISSVACAWRSWWIPIPVPAAAQYFFHRLCAAS